MFLFFCRVLLLGQSQVGKSSLCAQFMSSDHVNTYLRVGQSTFLIVLSYFVICAEDSVSKEVSVSVDGAETRLIFVDHEEGEMSLENQLSTYCPDGFLVVFAVDDESSLTEAENILNDIKSELGHKPCILVANKTDLVRNRIVRTAGRAKPSPVRQLELQSNIFN